VESLYLQQHAYPKIRITRVEAGEWAICAWFRVHGRAGGHVLRQRPRLASCSCGAVLEIVENKDEESRAA
jgi:hypothetical protein